jgi:hypothetical protein
MPINNNTWGLMPSSASGSFGDALMAQTKDQLDEERRRRLLQQKLAQLGSAGSISPAGQALFSSLGMGGLR